MADEDNENENAEGEEKAGGGKGKLIILIVAGLLVLGICVGGTLFALGFFDSSEEELAEGEEGAAEVAEEVIDKPSPAMYFPIKPVFVVNFPSRGRQRYLQVDVTVLTRDQEVFTALQTHLPLIKNNLNMLFSGEIYEELQTDEGKELLRQKASEALQDVMTQELGKPGVEEVLFTNFVMQ